MICVGLLLLCLRNHKLLQKLLLVGLQSGMNIIGCASFIKHSKPVHIIFTKVVYEELESFSSSMSLKPENKVIQYISVFIFV